MTKYVIGGLALVAMAAVGLVYFNRNAEPTPAELTEQLVTLMEQGDEAGATALIERTADRRMAGEIEVAGVVQDEAGNPLSAVTITYQQTLLAVNPANAKITKGEQTIDGAFELKCKDCSAIEADFVKPGYHEVHREWFAIGPELKEPRVVDRDAVVTLQAKGQRAHLERYSGTLKTGPEMVVLPFSFGRGRGLMSLERVLDVAAEENVRQPLYLRLIVDFDAAGTISIEQIARPGTNITFDRPRNPQLDFDTANGGVIAYEPTEQDVRLIEREMSRAPTSGYAPTLALKRMDGLPQYFFCRIGERYCRGSVDPVGHSRSADGQATAKVSVAIKLNTVAGDTNLTP